jgi:hypothetical protein
MRFPGSHPSLVRLKVPASGTRAKAGVWWRPGHDVAGPGEPDEIEYQASHTINRTLRGDLPWAPAAEYTSSLRKVPLVASREKNP